jgi:hypothetical protein
MTHHDHERPVDRLDCSTCQAEAAAGSLDVELHRVWTAVAAVAWAPKGSALERIAARLLRSPGLARALVTTPSLALAWLVATAAVLVIGVVVSVGAGTPLVPLLAPALAGAGISFAYGPGTDPAHELVAGMPVNDRMVLLARAIAVFGVNAGLGALASLLVPAAAGVTWLWLVPMTAVAALCLAAATMSGSAAIGLLTGLTGWTVTVLGTGMGSDTGVQAAVSAHPLMLAYLIVTVICVGVVLVKPDIAPEGKDSRGEC